MITGDQRCLAEAPLAVLDVETTGLSARGGDRVIEIGVVLTSGLEEVDHFEQLIDPGRPLDPRATAVNGITAQMVRGQPRFSEILPRLERLLDGRVLVAHNASFDLGFLREEYRRAGTRLPERPVLDTCRMARSHFSFPSNSLGALTRRFGISSRGAHRALADARMTLALLGALASLLESRGLRTLAQLAGAGPAGSSSRWRAPHPDLR